MNKKSILDQFASDAINAPEAVTGGGGNQKSKGTRTSRRQKTDHKTDRRTRN
jgi:hypothetical protein